MEQTGEWFAEINCYCSENTPFKKKGNLIDSYERSLIDVSLPKSDYNLE